MGVTKKRNKMCSLAAFPQNLHQPLPQNESGHEIVIKYRQIINLQGHGTPVPILAAIRRH
jgi:hypothetical protein